MSRQKETWNSLPEGKKEQIRQAGRAGFAKGRATMAAMDIPINTGKHHTVEVIEKIRQAQLGEKNSFYGKHHSSKTKAILRQSSLDLGLKPPYIDNPGTRFSGHHHTKESKLKTSLKVRKENHPLWQGGISYEPYSADFDWQLKQSIKERDNYTCQECSLTEAESIANGTQALDVHHINYDKQDGSQGNLITLCKHCNGVANFDRSYWEKHFKEKICVLNASVVIAPNMC